MQDTKNQEIDRKYAYRKDRKYKKYKNSEYIMILKKPRSGDKYTYSDAKKDWEQFRLMGKNGSTIADEIKDKNKWLIMIGYLNKIKEYQVVEEMLLGNIIRKKNIKPKSNLDKRKSRNRKKKRIIEKKK